MLVPGASSLLRNVTVIMSLGDSITAGFGAKWTLLTPLLDPLGHLKEDRGVAFSTGGDEGAVSLANLLQQMHGPAVEVLGKSHGSHGAALCLDRADGRAIGGFCPPSPLRYRPRLDGLNGALTGSTSGALNLQIDYLVSQFRDMRREYADRDLDAEWKLLTLHIGANDLCSFSCGDPQPRDVGHVAFFRQNVAMALSRLRGQFPRMIVVVERIATLSAIPDRVERLCRSTPWQRRFPRIECPCAYGEDDLGRRVREFNEALSETIATFAGSDEFVVVEMDTIGGWAMEDWPANFTSPLDCFHPSILAHERLARCLWQSLLEVL